MPDREAVKRALALLAGDAEHVYFFQRLASASWIEPLLEEGRFSSPPDAVRDGDYIRFPSWPESQYLARVAKSAPDAAARALHHVPLNDNQRVHLDLVEVALQIPLKDASEWARSEANWVSRQSWLSLLLPEKLAELANYLATSGQSQAALVLARELFVVRSNPRREVALMGQRSLPLDAVGKMDAWVYKRALGRLIAVLASTDDALDWARLFVLLLGDAVRFSAADLIAEPPTDYSFIWRDEIEQDEAAGADIRDALIDAVRDLMVALAPRVGCRRVLAALEEGRWDVFRRIAIHVVRVACSMDAELVHEVVVQHEAFSDPSIHHEYALLLRDAFAALSKSDQDTLLSWIEMGPDRDAMQRWHEGLAGSSPSDEEVDAWVEHWQRDRLSPVAGALPIAWRNRFDQLVSRHGAPVFDYSLHRTSGGWVGERSPVAADAFEAWSSEERRAFLREWIPPGGFDGPTRSGIVQHLGALPDQFFTSESQVAGAWAELHPAYVTALLSGFERVVKGGGTLSWPSVVDLCEAVARLASNGGETDWAKRSVADLLVAAFDSDPSALPPAEGPHVSHVIGLLVEGGFVSTEQRISPDADALTAAINSASGKALEAAIRFAIWSKRGAGTTVGSEWRLETQLPAVAGLLRRIANPDGGYSVDARAIFGLQLGPLLWLDSAWVVANRAALFPTEPKFSNHRRVVWDTYLLYGSPFGQVLDLCGDQYAISIGELREEDQVQEHRRNVASRVSEHLMVLYWQGYLPLRGATSPVRTFFRIGSRKIREHAIDFIGRSMMKSEDAPARPLELLRELIEWRLSVIREIRDPRVLAAEVGELEGFGWWFASGVFAAPWTLETLLAILRLGGKAEPDHMVAEELVRLAGDFPRYVAEALRLMIDQLQPDYGLAGWIDEARKLIETLGESDDSVVRSRVAATVETLLSRGYFEFRPLMPR